MRQVWSRGKGVRFAAMRFRFNLAARPSARADPCLTSEFDRRKLRGIPSYMFVCVRVRLYDFLLFAFVTHRLTICNITRQFNN